MPVRSYEALKMEKYNLKLMEQYKELVLHPPERERERERGGGVERRERERVSR